jgi:hypothetical protein
MKRKIFKLLITAKIIKNGYLNPLVLWGFLLLTPLAMYVVYHEKEEQKIYIADQELISMILNEYENNIETDLVVSDDESGTSTKTVVALEVGKPKVVKTKNSALDNLFLLMNKAKENRKSLTEWDHFRLKVYETSINLKKRYPEMGGSPEQIYDWSMKTFYQESKYKKDAQNPHSSAYGLFQAMANTRKNLNMPKGLSLLQQVPYYEKYIINQIDSQRLNVAQINTPLDWYLIVFYPNLSDKGDGVHFAKCGGYSKKYCTKKRGWKHCNYHANSGYDLNKDGIIYKTEIGQHLLQKY